MAIGAGEGVALGAAVGVAIDHPAIVTGVDITQGVGIGSAVRAARSYRRYSDGGQIAMGIFQATAGRSLHNGSKVATLICEHGYCVAMSRFCDELMGTVPTGVGL